MSRRTKLIGFAVLLVAAIGAAAALFATEDEPGRFPDANELSLTQLIGQRIVTGYIGTTPPQTILDAVEEGRVGGVTLYANNAPTPTDARNAIKKLNEAAEDGDQPPPFLLIDQEGGTVKRFQSLPPDRSASGIGESNNVAAIAKAEGLATGGALRALGFNVNLAPVVDVPATSKSFLGVRGYSTNRRTVATAGCAFARGLKSGGVAAVFKHFPGIGHSPIDTDRGVVAVEASRRELLADLAPYRRCPRTPDMVMLSNASYPDLQISTPSALSERTYELLRSTGFRGLTIGDAFSGPAMAAESDAPLRALEAGLDIVLFGQSEPLALQTHATLLAAAQAGRLAESDLRREVRAILRLKRELGDNRYVKD